MIFLFTLIKGINFVGDSVPNEEKVITTSYYTTPLLEAEYHAVDISD